MLKLFQSFLRYPVRTFFEKLESFSIESGMWIYIFFVSYSFTSSPQAFGMYKTLVSKTFGIENDLGTYAYLLFSITLAVASVKYINPFFLSLFLKKDTDMISENYQRIIYLATLPQVMFAVLFNLPLLLLASIFVYFDYSSISVGIGIISGIGGLLGIVLVVEYYFMIWKGIQAKFETSSYMTLFIVFILPLLMSIPFFIVFGDSYWDVLKNYLKT